MQPTPSVSFDQACLLLGVSANFLAQAVSKGRLKPLGDAPSDTQNMQFSLEDCAKFGELMQKLKAGGIAAMRDIAATDKH